MGVHDNAALFGLGDCQLGVVVASRALLLVVDALNLAIGRLAEEAAERSSRRPSTYGSRFGALGSL